MSLNDAISALAQSASNAVAAGERWERVVTNVLDALCAVGGADASRAVQRVTGNYRQRRNRMQMPSEPSEQ
ncbi:MAG: hypothetical protein IT582_09250 [Opitutaceae bacterium]|nr:hypothetical protein [Opitutaceae bacterium]